MGQEISVTNIASISGMSVEQILDKMVEKKIGITGNIENRATQIFNFEPVLGDIITIGTKEYRIVNISERGAVTVCLAYYDKSYYYSDGVFDTKLTEWYNTMIPDDLKAKNVFVNGPQHIPVFIPSVFNVSAASVTIEGTPHDTSSTCYQFFKNDGVGAFQDKSGKYYVWWTTTAGRNTSYYGINENGAASDWITAGGGGYVARSAAFRPFIQISRSAFA